MQKGQWPTEISIQLITARTFDYLNSIIALTILQRSVEIQQRGIKDLIIGNQSHNLNWESSYHLGKSLSGFFCLFVFRFFFFFLFPPCLFYKNSIYISLAKPGSLMQVFSSDSLNSSVFPKAKWKKKKN